MKRLKPTSPGQRGTVIPSFKDLSTSTPHKPLVRGAKRSKGRNNQGRITMRHRGGGHKRRLRDVDFLYLKRDIQAKVESIEYDPNRSSFVALVCYKDGERRYIVIPRGVKVGDQIINSEKCEVTLGNRMMLKNIPVGTLVHSVELKPEGGAKIARSAGVAVEVLGYDTKYTTVKMPSSESRKVPSNCFASIGELSNEEHRLRVIGKAGNKRHMGRRPIVRGAAMNAVDHPHGGGEGKAGRGRRRAITKWGKPADKGQKTRNPNKYSNNLITKRRRIKRRG